MKVYVVMNVKDEGTSMIEKVFSTLEKAEQYKLELENKFKDEIRFQYKFWYYEIETLEVE
jgi:uncharacterized protein YcfL